MKEIENSRQTPSISNSSLYQKNSVNRVYIMKVLKFQEDGTQLVLYKIGKSSGKNSVERMLQLMRSHFMQYRYSPFITIKRDRPCPNAFEIENKLHQKFKENKYYFDKPVDGKEEYFIIDREDILLRAYDELIPKAEK